MQNIPLFSPLPGMLNHGVSVTSFAVDSMANQVAAVFRSKGGTITQLGVYISSIAGSPNLEIRLESVTSGGIPSGTLAATNTKKQFTPVTGWQWLTLDAGYASTLGEVLAMRIQLVNFSAGNFANAWYRHAGMTSGPALPRVLTTNNSGSTWTTFHFYPVMGVKNGDGSVQPGFSAYSGVTSLSYHSASVPDEIGVKFSAPFAGNLSRIGSFVRLLATTAQVKFHLWQGGGSNDRSVDLLSGLDATLRGDKDTYTTNGPYFFEFPVGSVALVKDETYRLTCEALTSSATSISEYQFPDVESRDGAFGEGCKTSWDGTSWTDTLTRAISIVPWMSSVSGGGGGLMYPGVGRGLIRGA